MQSLGLVLGGGRLRLSGWVGSEGEANYRAERGERGRGEQDLVKPAGRIARFVELSRPDRERRQADGQVDEEDGSPAQCVGQHPADQPDGGGAAERGAEKDDCSDHNGSTGQASG